MARARIDIAGLLALAMLIPALRPASEGAITVSSLALRGVVALAIAWTGLAMLSSLVRLYSTAPAGPTEGRRRDDRAAPGGPGTDPGAGTDPADGH